MPQKVFLSYGHDENEELVRLIYEKLRERGHDPWIDRSEIKAGSDWREAISRGILDSSNFLAFISRHSVRVPGVCLDEISIGVGNWNCRMQSVLLEKDVAVPNSINNVQWLDFSDWKERRAVGPETWEKWFAGKMGQLYEIIEDEHATKVAGNITELEEKLRPLSAALKLRLILRDEIVGRQWLVKRIAKWFEEPDGGAGFVLYGRPGAGKSVVSAYLCNFSGHCAGTFFFEWNNAMTRDPRRFLRSLMFQLACSQEDYQGRLVEWLKTRNAQTLTEDELLEEGLLGLLNGLIDGGRGKKLVVLDAIDETLAEDGALLDTVIRLVSGAPRWLKFFMTSRPEAEIPGKFQGFERLDLDLHGREIAEDLKEYVSRGISDAETARRVTERSDGSFVCARELVRLWERNGGKLDMDGIPAGVGGIYHANFERLCRKTGEYREKYRPVLTLLLAAREQLSRKELLPMLDGDSEKWERALADLRSYVMEVRHGGDAYLQVFHRTFREWLLSDAAGKYRVDLSQADDIFAQHILEESSKVGCLSPYAMRYALDHLHNEGWEELPISRQESLCSKLLESARIHGSLEHEERYLKLAEETFGRNYFYYVAALEYHKKVSGRQVAAIAEEALSFKNGMADEEMAFGLACQIAFAFFYGGDARRARTLISSEREKHGAEFWRKGRHEAEYWHVVAVTAHDLDNNAAVVEAAEKDVVAYQKAKDYYGQYISMVNLFDGQMAMGDLTHAGEVAGKAFECTERRYFVGVDDILRICHGNLLQTAGRVMEALSEYEEGLRLAKGIQKWDYVYGSIWRELAMARYGDAHCLAALGKFRVVAEELGYQYLVSLADCFGLVAAHFMGLEPGGRLESLAEIRAIGLPGHVLQAEICCQLDGVCEEDRERVFACLDVCEGVKGESPLVGEYMRKFAKGWSEPERTKCRAWWARYAEPIERRRREWHAALARGLATGPKLARNTCAGCGAACCYDGVYLEEGEANGIQTFVEEHEDCFKDLPRPYIVSGDWPGLEGRPKTARIALEKRPEIYPAHFTATRCVFSSENGECRLQRVASDLQMHPWKAKPKACWLFPLRGGHGEQLWAPATDQRADPDRRGEEYPGYSTFLPCAKTDENGEDWARKYQYELEYYAYLKRIAGRGTEGRK